MRFEVLGPMRVTDERGTRPVAGVRQRILLGALLAHANQPMPAGQLAEFVWDGALPGRAVPTLRTYVARLRQNLGPDTASRIRTRDGGYMAEVGPGELDTLAFETLCRDAGSAVRAADWARASDHADAALALWRGTPLGDVPSQALRDAWLPHLDQQRVQVTEWWIEAELHLGRHEQLVPLLRQLTADHQLRERFHVQLMLALYRCGRQAEALAAYQDARKVLVGELGIEPGPELRHLHESILAGDDDPGAPQPSADPASRGTPVRAVPRQLPAAAGYFTGRRGELDLITGLLGPPRQPDIPGGAVVISAIDGMAGIGKTALAVHAAHQLAGKFPDGQLFMDLHGHTKGYLPREPGQALEILLRALDVPAPRIPADTDARASLYRQSLAGTQTLIVLDNARDEAQVRPLLPGAPGCLVLVTSRRRLKGLHDAHVVALDVLPETEAIALLRAVTGPAHAMASGPDLAALAGLCGRLPLALRIAGALLAHRPAWTPGHLAGMLRDERERLAALADGDHDLRAVFDLSYTGLDEPQRLLFRRLALVPGPECDAYAAAALLDDDVSAASGLLEDLVDHNLLIEHAPGRYRLHDLIRAHSRTLAEGDPQPDRDAALDRLLAYCTHTAQNASSLVARWPRLAPDGPAPACAPVLARYEEAKAWLSAERENLEAAWNYARSATLDEHAVALAAGLAEILRIDGFLAHALGLHQDAAGIAERRGWPAARATALTDLASVRLLAGDLSGAANAVTLALEIHRAAGNLTGEANALAELGRVRVVTGDLSGAVDAVTQALGIYRAVGNRLGEATALTELGRVRYTTGDLSGTVDAATQALGIYRAAGQRYGEAAALTELGRARLAAGEVSGAGEALSGALEICRAIGSRAGEAWVLNHYAAVVVASGDLTRALDLYQQALAMNHELNKPDDEAIALEGIGECLLAAGQAGVCATYLDQALEIYERLGMKPDIERVRTRLASVKDRADGTSGQARCDIGSTREPGAGRG